MRSLLLPTLFGFSLGALATLGLACSVGSEGTDGPGGYGGAYTGSGGSDRDASIDVAPDGENPPGPVSYGALCGTGDCDPSTVPCDPLPATTGAGGAGGAGGTGTGGAGGAGTGGGDPSIFACQVEIEAGEPKRVCSPAGSGLIDAPCLTGHDCSPGLSCVMAAQGAGLCRPYCCAELENCPPSETYCEPRPLFEDPGERVPVCVPVKDCTLLTEGMCEAGENCAVVRDDGTTSCVPSGTGQACDPCPCGPGFTCNFGTGVCEKLCHTGGSAECEGGTCQGGSSLPSGFGLCIGGQASCGF